MGQSRVLRSALASSALHGPLVWAHALALAGLLGPWFIGRARDAGGRRIRWDLLRGFARVRAHVVCAHLELEILMMADFLLSTGLDGPMVECGSYRGGSAAKLSLVARATGRTLYICDSFRGLPEPSLRDRTHALVSGGCVGYEAGGYRGGRGEVEQAIARYGVLTSCRFVEGFFEDTLPGLNVEPCFVFMDVDLIESARDCLRFLWPRLLPGGRFFTHEAGVRDFVMGIADSDWWTGTLGSCPPVLMGAGYGCGSQARQLAYFDKA